MTASDLLCIPEDYVSIETVEVWLEFAVREPTRRVEAWRLADSTGKRGPWTDRTAAENARTLRIAELISDRSKGWRPRGDAEVVLG
jgi:hypothetical protein